MFKFESYERWTSYSILLQTGQALSHSGAALASVIKMLDSFFLLKSGASGIKK